MQTVVSVCNRPGAAYAGDLQVAILGKVKRERGGLNLAGRRRDWLRLFDRCVGAVLIAGICYAYFFPGSYLRGDLAGILVRTVPGLGAFLMLRFLLAQELERRARGVSMEEAALRATGSPQGLLRAARNSILSAVVCLLLPFLVAALLKDISANAHRAILVLGVFFFPGVLWGLWRAYRFSKYAKSLLAQDAK